MTFLLPSLNDIIDIIIITLIIYQVMNVLHRTGGYQILYGLIILILIYIASVAFNLKMVFGMVNSLRSSWLLILVILFNQEIRSTMMEYNIFKELGRRLRPQATIQYYGTLIDAISSMSFRKIGGIIVIENKQRLTDYIHSGEILDSVISLRLIYSIFNPKSVLHDGAIVIRGDRILAAKVILPLSKNIEYNKIYGTRHIAGIGITEVTDALSIIISEQTGRIAVAQGGSIKINVAFEELMQIITDATK